MPTVNGSYQAPTWNNNAAPPIDAEELQAMCNTIEANQTPQSSAVQLSSEAQSALNLGTGTTLDDALELLKNASAFPIYSYVGNGGNSVTLNFSTKPNAVIFLYRGRTESSQPYAYMMPYCFLGVDYVGTKTLSYSYIDDGASERTVNFTWNSTGLALTLSGSSTGIGNFNYDFYEIYYTTV